MITRRMIYRQYVLESPLETGLFVVRNVSTGRLLAKSLYPILFAVHACILASSTLPPFFDDPISHLPQPPYMNSRVLGQFRMEAGTENVALLNGDDVSDLLI